PNSIIAVAASSRCREITREIFGDQMEYVPWMRPGFELGLAMQQICRNDSKAQAIMMGQHGFICWSNDDKECYQRTLEFIQRASEYIERKYAEKGGDQAAFGGPIAPALPVEVRRNVLARLLPWLRGQVSQQRRLIATIQDDESILRFVNSKDAARLAELGTSCPDHFLRTKIKPLYVALSPDDFKNVGQASRLSLTGQSPPGEASALGSGSDNASIIGHVEGLKAKLAAGLEQYRKDYAAYYERCKR